MKARKLNKQGIEKFKDYLKELDGSGDLNPPDLNSPMYSEPVEAIEVEVEEGKSFETRMELAKYLDEQIPDDVRDNKVLQMTSMWSWMAYLWLDQFVKEKNGEYSTYETKAYICSLNWKRYYRHFVSFTYYVYSLYGEENSRLFLQCPVNIRNEFLGQLAARESVLQHDAIIKAAHQIYWDDNEGDTKRGASSKNKPGTARRIGTVIKQLDVVYDLHGMDADQIVEILPGEFDRWKEVEEEAADEEEGKTKSISGKFRSLID